MVYVDGGTGSPVVHILKTSYLSKQSKTAHPGIRLFS